MKTKTEKLAVVIPAYNEERTIAKVIAGVLSSLNVSGSPCEAVVVVVDDCSTDGTALVAEECGAHVVRHTVNLGPGGATQTGIVYARRLGVETVVTLDADGQHDPKEIVCLLKEYEKNGSELVIGSRFLSKTVKEMPGIKKIGNRGLSLITNVLSGRSVSDSQSGFRLFGPKMIDILSVSDLAGYEFCSEVIMIANKKGYGISEVPITTIYDERRKTGQNPLNALNILMRLVYRKLVG